MSFREWILNEFPIDLSIVRDPFADPEFKQTLGKKKILVYHGTSTKYFWDIVEHGFKFDLNRRNWDNTSKGNFFAFTINRVEMYADKAVEKIGGQPIIFALELPMSFLEPDIDDREKWDAEAYLQTMTKHDIPPKYITGVIYPIDSPNKNEIPIKKFIERVNKEKISGIQPKNIIPSRFQMATPEDWIHVIINYLQDLMNYTSFTHYLYGNAYLEFNQKAIQALHKPEYNWHKVKYWQGEQWVDFLENLLNEKNEEDYYKTLPEFQRPLYSVIRKYEDIASYRVGRLGKKPKL